MSTEGNIGRAVLNLAEIVKSNTITAVAKANSEGTFNLTPEELSELAKLIGSQVDSTMRNSLESVTRLVR